MNFFRGILKHHRKALLTAIAFFVCAQNITSAQTAFNVSQKRSENIHRSASFTQPSPKRLSGDPVAIRTLNRSNFSDNFLLFPDKGKTHPGDTVKVKKHSPKAATWMSACVPGLGQIYNRKYWKLPIIYGGFGVLTYLGIRYHGKYVQYRDSYYYKMGVSPDIIDPFPRESTDIVLASRDFYRRNFELTCVIGGLLYILNVVDAAVDAHLYKFDVSDDLSFKVEPQLVPTSFNDSRSPGNGVKLTMRF